MFCLKKEFAHAKYFTEPSVKRETLLNQISLWNNIYIYKRGKSGHYTGTTHKVNVMFSVNSLCFSVIIQC
jgi:hypothetical protein